MPFEDSFAVRLRRTAEALEEVARLLLGDANQLGLTEMRILAYLADNGSAPGVEISRALRVDHAWISRLFQAMNRRGLIAQARAPSDRRVMLASLTETGRAVYEKTLFDVNRCSTAIMADLDEVLAVDMIAKLEANLRAVAQGIRAHDQAIFDY